MIHHRSFFKCFQKVQCVVGKQGFEKLISGMYMGDVVRRVMLKMAQEADLFGKPIPPKLLQPYTLT